MIKRKWFTITYYQNDVRKWIGKSPYWSRIHVNQIDDKVYDRESAIKYAELIRGDRDLSYVIESGKHK